MLKMTNEPDTMKLIKDLLRCSLCKQVFVEATTINACLHKFCKKCIYKEIEENDAENCPVCNEYLGPNPLKHLRSDETWRTIAKNITFVDMKKKVAEVKKQAGEHSKAPSDEEKEEENDGNLLPTSMQDDTTKQPLAFSGKVAPLRKDEVSMKYSEAENE